MFDGDPQVPRRDTTARGGPLVSIIVTHHNYAAHVEDALLWLLDQTHDDWECVVVDDGSDGWQKEAARETVARISVSAASPIRFVELPGNVGQIPAFFAGVAVTSGEFVCLLDPDDRYAKTFLEEMLAAHLNASVYCPIACCDQLLVKRPGEAVTGIYSTLPLRYLEEDRTGVFEVPASVPDRLLYIPAKIPGWHWTSTSSMMFRRPALELMRPRRALGYKRAADAYLAPGAHFLGGTLRLTKPLVYRTIHAHNSWLAEGVFASSQAKRRPAGDEVGHLCRADVVEMIKANGGGHHLIGPGRRGLIARWRRSLSKRWRRLTGREHGREADHG